MTSSYALGALRLDRALVTLDTETTGTDVTLDRVIEVAMIRLNPNGTSEEYRSLVNPQTPIPAESTQIHGITDAMVADAPTFAQIAQDLLDFLARADLAGYNLLRFDLPILRNEFQRASIRWNPKEVRIVDAQAIFHKMEPRDLTAAYRFYCGKELHGAHGALADTRATLEVLLAQVNHYPELPRDVASLDARFNLPDMRFVDPDRKFRWRNNEPSFNFGNHRGAMLREVVERDPEYLDWILKKDFSQEVKTLVRNALEGIIPTRPAVPVPDSADPSEDSSGSN